jgi:DNA-directed RNA polymerase specialized sigma24 family protein
MKHLAILDAQQMQIVELRCFGGLSVEETSHVLNISPATVKRDWAMAKAWLERELRNR